MVIGTLPLMHQGEHLTVIRVTILEGRPPFCRLLCSFSSFSSTSTLPQSGKQLQAFLVSKERLPVVLQMGIRFSKKEYYMGRPFDCLKLPELKLKLKLKKKKKKGIESSIGAFQQSAHTQQCSHTRLCKYILTFLYNYVLRSCLL